MGARLGFRAPTRPGSRGVLPALCRPAPDLREARPGDPAVGGEYRGRGGRPLARRYAGRAQRPHGVGTVRERCLSGDGRRGSGRVARRRTRDLAAATAGAHLLRRRFRCPRASRSPASTARDDDRGRGGRVIEDDLRGRARAARAGRGRCPPRRLRARLRRRSGRGPGRVLRGHLPARHSVRSGPDDAGGSGGLGVWRQDGRGSARCQELRRCLPPADRCPRRSSSAGDAARRGARGRIRRGREDRVDRRRPPLGARGGDRRAGSRHPRRSDLRVRTDEDRDRGRRRARLRPARSTQPGPHRGARDRDRDKKRTSEGLGFVLIERPGEPRWGESVDPDRVRAAVEELR